MNESNKTTNRAAEVAHQIYATVEGRAYPSARIPARASSGAQAIGSLQAPRRPAPRWAS